MSGTVIALGMFDGVHMGHRALLARAVALSKRLGATSMVYTFSNHPQKFLKGDVKLIMTEQRRRFLMMKMGVEQVVMVPFDQRMADTSPEEFLQHLKDEFDMRGVVAGYNYHFGQNGAGSEQKLLEFAEKHGIVYEKQPAVTHGAEPISSSRIRACIQEGLIDEANELLGDPFVVSGTVVGNKRIGTVLGFPTANVLARDDYVLPKQGVYITKTKWKGNESASVTNIGTNPTVGGKTLSIETHLLDVCDDLYSTQIWISFLHRLRDERTFDSIQELAKQIEKDVQATKRFFQ